MEGPQERATVSPTPVPAPPTDGPILEQSAPDAVAPDEVAVSEEAEAVPAPATTSEVPEQDRPPTQEVDGADTTDQLSVDAPGESALDGATAPQAAADTVAEQPIVVPEAEPQPGRRAGVATKVLAAAAAVTLVGAAFIVVVIIRPSVGTDTTSVAPGADAGPVSDLPASAAIADPPPEAAARGFIRMSSRPTGGIISVNGEPAGRAPGVLRMPPGEYDIRVSVPSYRDWTRTVEVAADDTLVLDADLVVLPASEVLEVTESRVGRDPYVDSDGLMRIGTFTDSFTLADDVNAVVYFRPNSFSIRDLTFTVVSRWQRPDGLPPIEQQGEQRVPIDWDQSFFRACAPALALDSRGSNVPLNLEVEVDGEVVARFTYRVGPGNPANASPNPCNPSAVPVRVASRVGG